MKTRHRAANATLTIERTYDATPERVFAAWADPEAKAAWFIGPGDWKARERSNDFRVGGRERLVGEWPDGSTTTFDGRYHDIVPNERIVYAFDMLRDGVRLSISLATVELESAGTGTTMRFTENLVCLDDYEDPHGEDRKRGTNALFDRLENYLERTPQSV